MITKKDVLALCNEPSQAFVERWINSEEQADIKYLGIERTEDNRSRKEFTLIYSQFDRYNNKEIVSTAVLSDAGTKGAACFFGGLSHFGELLFVYLFAHRRAVRILCTGYLFLFIFRLVQLRILLEEYQTATDDLNDLGLRLCRYLLGDLARGLRKPHCH